MFRAVSQTAVNYLDSALSEGRAGEVHGGDRLPWIPPDAAANHAADNFNPLTSLDWQVHVYGEASAGLADACREKGLALHAFPWNSGASRTGLKPGATYFVRPDGYIGMADPEGSPIKLVDYLQTRDVRPLRRAAPDPT